MLDVIIAKYKKFGVLMYELVICGSSKMVQDDIFQTCQIFHLSCNDNLNKTKCSNFTTMVSIRLSIPKIDKLDLTLIFRVYHDYVFHFGLNLRQL